MSEGKNGGLSRENRKYWKKLDPSRLHATYLQRRKRYSEHIPKDRTSELARKLTHAALATDLCLSTYVDLVNAITRHSESRLELRKRASASEQAAMQQLLGSRIDASDGQLELLRGLAERTVETGEAIEAAFDVDQLFSMQLNAVAYFSLEALLRANDAEQLGHVVRATAKGFLCLIPGVGEAMDVWEIYQSRKDPWGPDIERAQRLEKDIDDFIQAAYEWSLMLQVSANHLSAPASLEKIGHPDEAQCLKVASEEVSRRFNALIQEPSPPKSPERPP
jgi:hypothetical protein